MADKYIVAVSDALITHDSLENAKEFAAQKRTARPLVVYEIRPVAIVHPVHGLTNDDVTPPEGGTPILMRAAA